MLLGNPRSTNVPVNLRNLCGKLICYVLLFVNFSEVGSNSTDVPLKSFNLSYWNQRCHLFSSPCRCWRNGIISSQFKSSFIVGSVFYSHDIGSSPDKFAFRWSAPEVEVSLWWNYMDWRGFQYYITDRLCRWQDIAHTLSSNTRWMLTVTPPIHSILLHFILDTACTCQRSCRTRHNFPSTRHPVYNDVT
jgi:hypothetical protein